MAHGSVLVVEDDRDIREALVEFLELDGFEALAAEHGAAALDALRAHPHVRLILLDLSMPIMDGRTFRKRQQQDPALASIPVIVVSAVADCARVAAELEVESCFQKPLRWEELLHEVQRLAA